MAETQEASARTVEEEEEGTQKFQLQAVECAAAPAAAEAAAVAGAETAPPLTRPPCHCLAAPVPPAGPEAAPACPEAEEPEAEEPESQELEAQEVAGEVATPPGPAVAAAGSQAGQPEAAEPGGLAAAVVAAAEWSKAQVQAACFLAQQTHLVPAVEAQACEPWSAE